MAQDSLTLFSEADPDAYNGWLLLLEKSPASWDTSIDCGITRSQLRDALSGARVLSRCKCPNPLCSFYRFHLDGATKAYSVSFRVPSGDATLRITATGQIYEAQRVEDAVPTYPYSRIRYRRRLSADIAHELGHAIAAQSVGWSVTELEFPIVDTSQFPPLASGISKTQVRYDSDPDKMLIVAAAGVVAECQFDGTEAKVAKNPMRLFESYEDYQSDLLKAVLACGDDFSEARFVQSVQKAREMLAPYAAVVATVANERTEYAYDKRVASFTILWNDGLRKILSL